MKYFAIPLLAGAVLCCTQALAQKLEFKEHISKEFNLSNAASNTLAIYNITGFIKVEGYNGNKVMLEIDKTISAKTQEVLDEAKEEFEFSIDQTADSVIAYIKVPYDSRPNRNWKNNGDSRKIHYNYELNFTVKVPYSLNLHISTVNGGDVMINDVVGSLGAHNVNGAIKIVNAKGAAKVRTVNGNVEVNYVTLPPGESDFKTLNGDIKVTYPPALSVDCQFKTFNGGFYTDFNDIETLPSKVVKNTETHDSKTVYKLNADAMIRVGKGGPVYKFETFNGNIYLKKQS